MPLFGIGMLADTGWVVWIPHRVQMDCGMPWADREDQVVMLHPLGWWVGANSPIGSKELMPGTYRMVLMGGNRREVRSPSFNLP
jgi:hypothetical protein